ncbi:TorA maturation chaperone TorD [Mesocricetibacter intestinalis]|uniref:Probable Tat proofreading chaperone DmsD n=1 Tax=Mesocricetibacter intestinalis TaxID=1521930 RepID=A0A4R6VFM9_9PAST|nr:Tat proofreading chaperone DmsD [Mesocricetibacter intestinalis]TDQ59579.1 TorA maturation chaperone TorD [Mesocricetibacter intestinalis]
MQQTLLQEISTYGRLLGAAFYYAPQAQEVKPILAFFERPNWIEDWHILTVSEEIQGLIRKGLSRDLDEAYQYLFIGPNALPAPPWGSVYLDREGVIFGDSLLELRTFLKWHKITFSLDLNEPEDHFGLMLMLAAYLAENHPPLLNEFLAQHLLTWSGRYLQLLAEQTDYPFYQALSLLAQQTLQRWQEKLMLEVPKLQLYR